MMLRFKSKQAPSSKIEDWLNGLMLYLGYCHFCCKNQTYQCSQWIDLFIVSYDSANKQK